MSERCQRCILPKLFPGLVLEDGVCQFCRSNTPSTPSEQALSEVFATRQGDYDCLLALSGGKDSSYTLWHLREKLGLRVFAFTYDNGFLSERARRNCEMLASNLGVHWELITAARADVEAILRCTVEQLIAVSRDTVFARPLLEFGPLHYASGSLYMHQAAQLAAYHRIGVVVTGFTAVQDTSYYGSSTQIAVGKQTPTGSAAVLGFVQASRALQRLLKAHLEASLVERHFSLDEGDETFLRSVPMIRLFDHVQFDLDDVYAQIQQLGWQRPSDTGVGSTNDLLNPLSNRVYKKVWGFERQTIQLSGYVRRGQMTREAALAELETPEDPQLIASVAKRLRLPDEVWQT